ncbi:MAG: inorganic phosphate transporter [Longimicrobiales bacterium]
MLPLLLIAAVCLLAYSNGANDNPNGVATLFGSETSDYRTAIHWATITTFLGSMASLVLAQALVDVFSGRGLVPEPVAAGELFVLAVGAGAGGTVMLATVLGLPVSTTHSLVGGLAGAGILAAGSTFDASVLGWVFFLPLLASPLMAMILAAGLYAVAHRARIGLGVEEGDWVCVGDSAAVLDGGKVAEDGTGVLSFRASAPELSVGSRDSCQGRYRGHFLGVGAGRALDAAHFLSSGLVSFARGVSDTPKIAALLVVLEMVDVRVGTAVLAVLIAVGALLSARKVGHTMGHRITRMNPGQGFTANLTTAALVIGASGIGLAVSTTHVSVGSIFGIGLLGGETDTRVARDIVLSWVVTLPCAALLGALVYGTGQVLI